MRRLSNYKQRGNQGFTLLEVSAVILVVSTGMMSVMALLLTARRDANRIIVNTTAMEVAQTVLSDVNLDGLVVDDTNPEKTYDVNGFFVTRTVDSSDIINDNGGTVEYVTVRVYQEDGGAEVIGLRSVLWSR